MTDREEPERIEFTEIWGRECGRIYAELAGRLERPFNAKDRLAVETALLKAANVGCRAGVGRAADALERWSPDLTVEIMDQIDDSDPWAEAYGSA